jgi:hypothetical protein
MRAGRRFSAAGMLEGYAKSRAVLFTMVLINEPSAARKM